jgi:hypothetical protein
VVPAARAAVLQDANLLAEVLSFLPLPGTVLLTREVARFWRDTAKRPLLRVALQALALKRAKFMSDAYASFRLQRGRGLQAAHSGDLLANLHPAVKWLVHSFENSICSAVFDQAGGCRKYVVDALVWFLDQGLHRLLIAAQPSALRDWARVLQAAGVSCTLRVTTDHHEELHARLNRNDPNHPSQRTPVVLLCTPSQLELELGRVEREGQEAFGAIFGARSWQYAVFDAAPMVHLHETQQVALSKRLSAHLRPQVNPLVCVLLSASPPPTQLQMLAPLLHLCRSSFQHRLLHEEMGPGADVDLYSRVLEVVDRFCMGDAETRQWALNDYLPSEVAYLLRPCLLHVQNCPLGSP